MKNKVLELLKAKNLNSGGKCGIRLIDFNLPLKELELVLDELFTEGLITYHDNQHGKLVMFSEQLNIFDAGA